MYIDKLITSLKQLCMEENMIVDSIKKRKLQLDLFEKFKYFKVPALCCLIGATCLTKGFQDFTFLDYYEVSSKIGFLFFGLGAISLVFKLNRLKLISVENLNLKAKECILYVAEKRKWKTELNSEKLIIFKTVPIKGYDDYIVNNKHEGEKIYVFFDQKKIFLRSIDNLDNFSFKIQNGENSSNEKTLVNVINTANKSG